MPTHYETSIEIDAAPQAVWEVVARPDLFADWDSGVIRVEGAEGGAAEGRKVKLESSANPGKAFPITITELTAPRRMVFSGGMPLGLFTGTRVYTIEPVGEGRSRFTMREDHTGPMAGMITRSIPDLQPSFDQFAAGLKSDAEKTGGAA